MRQLSEWDKFKITAVTMVFLYIMAPLIYEVVFLPSRQVLIKRYERELESIQLDDIPEIEIANKSFIKFRIYVSKYRVVNNDPFTVMETIERKFLENDWKRLSQSKSSDGKLIDFRMKKNPYLVKVSESNKMVRIEIKIKGLYGD